jgi:alkylation response protein AidB-like acyl-CoA dehydrogenase
MISLAREVERSDDPVVRQELMKLHTQVEVIRMTGLYLKAGLGRTGVEGNLAKVRMTAAIRQAAHVGNLLAGVHATVDGDDSLTAGSVQELTVFAPGPAIYGGTDEIQRNVIGERGLGLPKEPGPAKETPFNELLSN